jgi:hypothetical protein
VTTEWLKDFSSDLHEYRRDGMTWMSAGSNRLDATGFPPWSASLDMLTPDEATRVIVAVPVATMRVSSISTEHRCVEARGFGVDQADARRRAEEAAEAMGKAKGERHA